MMFTLRQAAEAVGKSPATISKAVKSGTISIAGKSGKSFQIEASELFRVFPPNEHHNTNINTENERLNNDNLLKISKLEAELEASRKEVLKLEADKEDYKKRLDEESEERRKLTMMIADQREKPPQTPVEPRKKFLGIF